jgi:hypothetical protein
MCTSINGERNQTRVAHSATQKQVADHSQSDSAASQSAEFQTLVGNQAVGRIMAGTAEGAFEAMMGAELGGALTGAETQGLTGSNQMMLAKMQTLKRDHSGTGTASGDVLRMVAASQGKPLPPAIAQCMSAALGHDFSNVHIHTDAAAAHAAQGIGAKAFAQGSDVYFDAGQFQPGSSGGDKLLAHELAHVVQHESGRVPTSKDAMVSTPSDGLERQADAMANRARSYNEVDALDEMTEMVAPVADIDRTPLLRQEEPNSPGVHQMCDEQSREERERFFSETFRVKRFVASYGGCFDAVLEPNSGLLSVTLRLSFSFHDECSKETRLSGPSTWTDEDSNAFIQQFMASAHESWSAKFVISCTRPGWEDLWVLPMLTIERVDESADPHYTVSVFKMAAESDREDYAYVKDGGTAGTGRREGEARLFADSAQPVDLGYPATPVYVDQMREGVEKHRVNYLTSFMGDAIISPWQARKFSYVAAILISTNEPTHLPTLHIEGAQKESDLTFHEDAKTRLIDAGVGLPIEFVCTNDNAWNEIGFTLAAQANFQTHQVPGDHEVGHMLGAPDHYRENAPDLVQKMKRIIASEGVHDIVQNKDTDSIMNVGDRVLAAHYIPLKQALAEMTCDYLMPNEWQIG